MKEQDFLHLIGEVDDRFIAEMCDTYAGETSVLSSFTERRTAKNMNTTHKAMRLGKNYKRIISIAAAIAVFLALGTIAYAADLFGLRALLRPENADIEYSELSLSQPQAVPENLNPVIAEKVNNSRAAWAEWIQWHTEQDQSEPSLPAVLENEPEGVHAFDTRTNADGTITATYYAKDGTVLEERLLSVDEYAEYEDFMRITSGDSKYDYNVYSDEQVAKLEEIAEKYGLALRGKSQVRWSSETTGQTGGSFLTNAQLAAKTAEFGNGGNIFRQTPDGFDKVYWFNEGTFAVSYYVELPSGERVNCYGYNSMYSTLSSGTEVVNWESDLSGFSERAYTTADGTEVTILSNGSSAYIYVYLENSFFAEHINGTNSLSDADLNAVADMINYSLISK